MRPPSAAQSRAGAVAPTPRGFPVVACPDSIARDTRCLLLTHTSISSRGSRDFGGGGVSEVRGLQARRRPLRNNDGHVDPERNDPGREGGAGPRLLELRRGIRGRTDDGSSAGGCRASREVRGRGGGPGLRGTRILAVVRKPRTLRAAKAP